MELNYRVKVTDKGQKRISKLDRLLAKKIIEKIELLSTFRTLNNVKSLKGEIKDGYRLRVGDLRIIFQVDEINKIVWVMEIGYRGSVYR